MVYIEDTGSLYDAPIDVVWKYMQSDDHIKAHNTVRNGEAQILSETSVLFTGETLVDGRWAKDVSRVTVFAPIGQAVEVLEGHWAGSRMLHLYRPRGDKTQVDVFAEVTSSTIPAKDLERVFRQSLEIAFNEDTPGVRAFSAKK